MASSDPDGLERVAEDKGFIEQAKTRCRSPRDYTIPGIDDPRMTTILSGLVGLVIVFGLMWGLGRLLARRRTA